MPLFCSSTPLTSSNKHCIVHIFRLWLLTIFYTHNNQIMVTYHNFYTHNQIMVTYHNFYTHNQIMVTYHNFYTHNNLVWQSIDRPFSNVGSPLLCPLFLSLVYLPACNLQESRQP